MRPTWGSTARANERARMALRDRCVEAEEQPLPHAAEERSPGRIRACGQVRISSLGIACFPPVATRERPAREGGARENPSLSPQPCANGTLPSPRYPTKLTHQRAHVPAPIQHGHMNALAVNPAAYLGRTNSTKEVREASPGSPSRKGRHARRRAHLPSTCSTK